MTFSSDALLTLADMNLAEANREHARFLPPTQILECDDRLFVACGTRFPAGPFNSAVALGAGPADASAFLAAAHAHYAALGRGFTIYTRAHLDAELASACERAGYPRLGESPGMVLLERVALRALAPGVEIHTVTTPAQALDFVEVCASAYETLAFPAPVTRKVFSQTAQWLAPHWHVKLVYEQGRPVAGAMLLFTRGIAGVYWVGTVTDARGRGHADALMRALSCYAFDAGARAVVLQATSFGEPVYRRIGYREITRYPWYLVLAEQAASAVAVG